MSLHFLLHLAPHFFVSNQSHMQPWVNVEGAKGNEQHNQVN